MHDPVVFRIAVLNFTRIGLHVLSHGDDDSEEAVAMISRPSEIIDSFSIAKAVSPGFKIRPIESVINNRFRSEVETVSP